MMGSDVGIFWHGLRHRSGDSVGGGYGGVVGRGEVGHGEVGYRLTVEMSGFWWVGSKRVWGGFLHQFFSPFCLLSPLCSISLVVFDVGFAFGFVWFAVPISLVFFFLLFFLRWRWWMWVCANGGWSVLLRQWLLVPVVAAVVDVLLLLMVMRGRR